MFEFNIELDPYSIHLGIDGYSLGDISIKGDYGYLSSSRDTGSNQSIMIFISLSNLLDGITSLNNSKQYIFKGIDSSFDFCIFRNKKGIIVTDKKRRKIAEASKKEFIQTVWESVNKFVSKYRTSLEDGEAVTIDLDNSIKEFKKQFSDIIEPFEKISSTKEINKSQLSKLSQPKITEELLSFKPEFPSEPAHVLAPGIEGLFSEYFGQSYDELYQKYNSYRIIPLAVASYKERVEPVVVKLSISEIEGLIDREYDEKTLKNQIFPKYGIKVEMSKLGVTYIGFLERVHEELVGKRLYY